MFAIVYSSRAQEDLRKLKKNEPAAFQKALKLLTNWLIIPKRELVILNH